MTEPVLMQERGGIETYLIEHDGKQYVRKVLAKPSTLTDLNALDVEAKALQNLNHPNIPKFVSLHANGELALMREYRPGKSLQEHLSEGRLFSQEETKYIALQVLDTLAYVHDKGIIHRDIKPSNVIYEEESRQVSLVDFGLAKLYAFGGSTSSTTGGTFSYTAPEQFYNKAYPSSDIFALGATLVEILTGRKMDQYLINDNIQEGFDLSSLLIEPRFKERLQRMVEVNPKRRYQSAHELQELLQDQTGVVGSNHMISTAAIAVTPFGSYQSIDDTLEDTLRMFKDKEAGFNDVKVLSEKIKLLLSQSGYELMTKSGSEQEHLSFYIRGKTSAVDQPIEVVVTGQNNDIWALTLKRKDLLKKLYSNINIYLGFVQEIKKPDYYDCKLENKVWAAMRYKTPEGYNQLKELAMKKSTSTSEGLDGLFRSAFLGSISAVVGFTACIDYMEYKSPNFSGGFETFGEILSKLPSDSPIRTTLFALLSLTTVGMLGYISVKNIKTNINFRKQLNTQQQKLLSFEQADEWKPYIGDIISGVDAIYYIANTRNGK